MVKIKIYADGADLNEMIRLNADPMVDGLTTNPSLMRKAGITDYMAFAAEVLGHVTEKPISFEVLSDDLDEMERQAQKIAHWGKNVFVKIPITNAAGLTTIPMIERLSRDGVKVNVTAVLTHEQSYNAAHALDMNIDAIISIFNGRIMDTGRPPMSAFTTSRLHQTLWASTREPYNIWQAERMGYDIITVPPAILAKARDMAGKDLTQLSLETVQMFARDGAGYSL